MKRGSDDDALSWGDENDPTYVAPELADDEPADERPHDEPADDESHAETAADDRPHAEAPAAAAAGATAESERVAEPVKQDASGSPRWASGATAADVSERNRSAVERAKTGQADAAADAAADDELAEAEAAGAQLSSPALIAFGTIGGIYFLYSIGWFVSLLRSSPDASGLAGIVQIVLTVLALAAPLIWFAGVLYIGYRRSVRVRLAWLLVGVVVLIPWPFIGGR